MSGTKAGSQERPKPKPEDFIFGKMVGEGSFSFVFLARDANVPVPGVALGSNSDSAKSRVSNGKFREYAIKVCEKSKIIKESKQKYVYREKDILATITKHLSPRVPFFVVLHSTFQDTRNFYFCMTFAKNGDLLKCIDKMAERDIDCVQFYAAEILAAVEFLHFKVGVIHRDLKPENVLLDEKMHILITDFGSAKFLKEKYNINNNKSASETKGIVGPSSDSDTSDSDVEPSKPEIDRSHQGTEDEEVPSRPKQRRSFVGTAQYVSPEILRARGSSRASDLWAIGCIIYQMITGLPPFQAPNEWLIFKKIEKLEYSFQEGFNDDAKDLITWLLVTEPKERLGASDKKEYKSLRDHPFFKGVNFDKLSETRSPALNLVQELFGNQPGEPDPIWAKEPDAKPGAERLPMLMLRDGGSSSSNSSAGSLEEQTSCPEFQRPNTSSDHQPSTSSGDSDQWRLTKRNKNNVLQSQNFSESERIRSLRDQKETNKYHRFVENNLILKEGILHKKMGLFARRRMFLLTEGPRLYYVDPDKMVLKGQVPLSRSVRTEIKDPRTFFLHTPNRVYYLLDPSSNANEWTLAIEEVRDRFFGPPGDLDPAQPSQSRGGGDESHLK